jgi:hypothetical protein
MSSRVIFPDLKTALATSSFFIDEEGTGIWLGTDDKTHLKQGKCIELKRNALHIPSEDKTGKKLSQTLLKDFLSHAKALGLTKLHKATGYWTHSQSQTLQKEAVQIAWTKQSINKPALLELAQRILKEAHQDTVAYELNGAVEHLS